MFDDILIPTDGSEGIQGAVEHGLMLADRYGATVHALYVLDLGYSNDRIPDSTVWRTFRQERKQVGEQSTEAVATRATDLDLDVTVIEAVRRGSPSRAIAEYVNEHGIDLVAMGTHGRTGLNRYLLGSVTASVVRSVPVPTLTVQLTEDAQQTGYSDILIATDGTAGSNDATLHAISLARQYDALLHTLYVVDSKYDTNAAVQSALERDGKRAIAEVCVKAAALGVSTEASVLTGVPSEEIMRYTDDENIGLLVLGTHGRTGIDRFVMGSVAERLIRSVHTPVLTVKSTDEDSDPVELTESNDP